MSCWMWLWICSKVGWRARAKTAAEREQPWVVPVLVELRWMWCKLSVHKLVVEREYQVWAMVLRVGQSVEVLVIMDCRGIVVKASVRSKWMMVWSGCCW